MPAQLDTTKAAADFGITIRDSAATLAFYCGLLGLEHVTDMPLPRGGAGIMHRVACGQSVLKFVRFDTTPVASNPPGGASGATGLRYLTIWVTNLDALIDECAAANVTILVKPTLARPGVRMSFVEDPDGNWVELVESTPV